MTENKQLQIETLENVLLDNVQAQQEQPTSKPKKKTAIVRVPKIGEYVVFTDKLLQVLETDAESEEGEIFVVVHKYKKPGQCLVIPRQAFFEEYESKEFIDSAPTGKTFKYTPNKKNQTITFFETSNTRRTKETSFYYPNPELLETMKKEEEKKQAEKDAKKAAKKAQKEQAE